MEHFSCAVRKACDIQVDIYGSFLLFMFRVCHAFLFVHCSLVVTCWERTDLLALLYVMFYCVLSLSHVVSWVRCGACLFRFLIIESFSYFDGRWRTGRLKMSWEKLTEKDCHEWKLTTVDPYEKSAWRSGVSSAMRAACS